MRKELKKLPGIIIITACLAIICLVIITACDTPLGLGFKINTTVPVISNVPEGSQPGSYLRGEKNIIVLDVKQEFGISSVFMEIWYTNEESNKLSKTIGAFKNNKGLWEVNIDTTGMADGPIKSKVTAVDRDGKTTTTTDMVFIVKNIPPQIELTIPRIKGNSFDDSDLNKVLKEAPLFQGSDIMGIATDAFGIEEGSPQVLIWPADYPNVDINGVVRETDPKWGKWREAVDENYRSLRGGGLNAVQFRWPLVEFIKDGAGWRLPEGSEFFNPQITKDLPVGVYRVKIRVTDSFGTENIYPNRINNIFYLSDKDQSLNHYIEINLAAAKNPSVKWFEFPQYYNGSGVFTAIAGITTPNESISSVRVHASGSAEAVFTNADSSYAKQADFGNNWIITIDAQDMRKMLGIPEGQKMASDVILHIEAIDNLGNRTAASRQFIIDDIKPTLEFIEPAALINSGTENFEPPKVTSTVTIRGASIDNQRAVRLYYALGKTETNAPLGYAYNDHSGWTDTGLHDRPADSHKGLNARWTGSLSNWSWRFEDIADLCQYENSAYYLEEYDAGANLWLLPIKFKVVDAAGNVNIYPVELIVDPDADKPMVSITSHSERQIVGGLVRVSGTAADNEWINKVEIRVTAQSDSGCGTGNAPDIPVTGGVFVPVSITGSPGAAANWYYSINENGSLDPPKGKTRAVLLEVRAWDASMYNQAVPKNYSETQMTLVFDLSVPVIEKITLIRGSPDKIGTAFEEPLLPATIAKEFVTLKAIVRDDSGITSIKLRSHTGNAEYSQYSEYIEKNTVNLAEPWVAPPRVLHGGDYITAGKKYWIKESHGSDLNGFQNEGDKSDGRNTVFTAAKSGVFTGGSVLVEANAEDGTTQYFEYTVYIPLDTNSADTKLFTGGWFFNSAGICGIDIQVLDNTSPMPFITLDTFTIQIDNYYPAASFAGNLSASGNYAIYGKAWDTGDSSIGVAGLARVAVYFSREGKLISFADGTPGSIAACSAAAGGIYATNEYFIVIDSSQSGPYSPRFTGPPAEKDWSAIYPTVNLSDGPLTLHYVVYDSAENATHYSKEIYIANNRPVITGITLGTDIDGSGNVLPDGYVDFPAAQYPQLITGEALETGFRVRNNRFSIRLNIAGGNGNKYCGVSHVYRTQNEGEAGIPVSAIVKGEVYSIADPGSGINWINYGLSGTPARGVIFIAARSHSELAAAGLITGSGGAVYTYRTAGDPSKTAKEADNITDSAEIVFTAESFIGKGSIEDSAKNLFNGIMTPQFDRIFLATIYDTTVPGHDKVNQLSRAVLIKITVDNNDETAPVITVNPFYWNSETDNSLYRNSRNNGHIELENYLPLKPTGVSGIDDMDPKVSGRISFRGTGTDNHVIESIKFRINNFRGGAVLTAAVLCGSEWISNSASEADFENYGWKFYAEGMPSQTGHTVNWQLDFDSGFIADTVMADNILTVYAEDKAKNSSNPGGFIQTAGKAKTAHYRFDTVPYITEVITSLSGAYISNPSAFSRSALGGYPVREEETILIKGFNLGGGSAVVKVNGLALDGAGAVRTAAQAAAAQITAAQITANISELNSPAGYNTIVSGNLEVIVAGIPSLNNYNNNSAAWNREPNNLNNNNLTDDRRLYVWNTGWLLNQRVVQSPFMRMAPDSTRYMSYGLYDGFGRFYVRRDNEPSSHTAAKQVEFWENRYLNTTVAFDEYGDWYAAASNMTAVNYPHFTFYARDKAGGNNGAAGSNKRIIMRMAYAPNLFDVNRARIPRLFVQSTDGPVKGNNSKAVRIFMSYYDNGSGDNPVLFHYGTVGADNNFHGDLASNNNKGFARHQQAQVVADNTTAYKGSAYTAVGALSNGLPVIAWYDRFSQNLMFSHGGSGDSSPLNGTALGKTYNGTDSYLIPDSAGIEYVYEAANHGLVSGAGSANKYLVIGSENSDPAPARYFARRISGARFIFDTSANGTGSNQNNGLNLGSSVTISRPWSAAQGASDHSGSDGSGSSTTSWYTLPSGHGLSTGDLIYISTGTTAANHTLKKYYVRAVNGNRAKFSSRNTAEHSYFLKQSGSAGNYNVSVYMLNSGYTFNAEASAEKYYFPNNSIASGNTVTIGGAEYTVAERWNGNGTKNFKLADPETGKTVSLPGSNPVIWTSGGNTVITETGSPLIAGTWQGNAVKIADFAGAHVDMAVDAADNIHLAYYDVRNGGLHYAYIPAISANTTTARPDTNPAHIKKARVDTFLSAGTRLMINTRCDGNLPDGSPRYVPYISYFHASFAETKNSIRVAWRRDFTGGAFDGTDTSDRFTGAWEVMTVPAGTVPMPDEFICHGVPSSPYWKVPGGSSALHYNKSMNKTILVGYMTTDWYEGAVLKDKLW
ncbi:MAG: hypothetical protein FWD78_12585 [Treponema sp.]|nr:hypothetical protein [Treponema sp.]